ncbi:MAG: 3-keto-5-aminohexanoate cleavage protein [Syntrophomonadaceae bacterium]|nr:3-keto-5-aminohexanoate cleavage protein [Syntrophomonadaceae bacterium]
MATDKVNWAYIEEWKKKETFKTIWIPYGLPEVVDPTNTCYAEGIDVQPPWNIPQKIAISTTITGAFYSKRVNPNHPQTPEEIYQSAREACLAGSPIVHIHVRDKDGYNVLDPELFHRVIDPLRKEFPETVFDGCMVPFLEGEWDNMIEVLKAGLLDVTPINTVAAYCGDTLFVKPPHVMIEKTRLVQEYGIKPQIAIYADGDIDNADRYLIKTGLLQKPYHWIILPTLPGGSPMQNPKAMVEGLMYMVNRIYEIDDTSVILVCAAGRASSYLATFATLLGLHIRVGMEDTVWKWPHRNDKITNNAEHFKTFKQLVEILGRDVATPNEYRKMIGLPLKNV